MRTQFVKHICPINLPNSFDRLIFKSHLAVGTEDVEDIVVDPGRGANVLMKRIPYFQAFTIT